MTTALEELEKIKRQIAASAATVTNAAFTRSELVAPVALSDKERRQALIAHLPEDHTPYTDKYFLRTREILAHDGLNPWVRAQVFIRKGPGEAFGIQEALAIVQKYSKLIEHGGRVFVKDEGERFEGGEPLMFIEGPVQDIIELKP